MSNDTLTLIFTFVASQLAVVLAFLKWYIELKNQVNTNAAIGQAQRTELRNLVVSLLAELGYSHLDTSPPGAPPAAILPTVQTSKELQ